MNPNEAEALRRLYPRLLAKTLALTRSLPDAEDAVQDAVARALESWPQRGAPDSPEAWLLTVAANAHRDRLRRSRRAAAHQDAVAVLAQMSPWVRIALGEAEIARGWKDELLGLLFACCHPCLEEGESAALALATVIGLSTSEVASAFLVAPRSMEQRLTRARQRLRDRGDGADLDADRAGERLPAVLRAVHLLFNEGYWSKSEAAPIRADLCRLAVGLARSLREACPGASEVAGLLCLLLLHDARRAARLSPDGQAVPLPEQDRTRWDRAAIERASELLERTLERAEPGPYQIEAAISALHCQAERAELTDWHEISLLYALLESFRPTPAVRVNRAFAVARAQGAEHGLSLLDESEASIGYQYGALVRGVLLAELGRVAEARTYLESALGQAQNPSETAQIRARLAALSD